MGLLERDSFLDALSAARIRADAGDGCLVAVSGEAGIGKSSLVAEFARRVTGDGTGTPVRWGACDALFTPRPLGPLADMARQVDGRLRAALEANASRERIFHAFLEDLHHVPATLVIVEDVHWADDATLDLLKFAGRRLRGLPALLVVTYRDDELRPDHPLRLLLAEMAQVSMRRLHLSRLSRQAVAQLAEAAGRSPEGIYAASGGNPFYVTELLAAGDGAIPASVRDAVFARAARIPLPARRLLDAVAVVPGRAERQLVEEVVSPAPEEVEACVAAGMLESAGGHLAFRHELARLAWERSIEEGRAAGLHARVLAALRNQGSVAGVARLVHHAARAGDDAAVLRFGPAAAAEAARLGCHREAASHYRSTLDHAATLAPRERAELLDALAYELYLLGDAEAAIGVREDALALWTALGERERQGTELRWFSRLHWYRNDKAEALRQALAAIEVLEPLGPGSALAMAYSNRSQLHMLASEEDLAILWGTRAIDMAEAIGDVETLVHALNNVGIARCKIRRDPDERAPVERSLALALHHGLQEHAARAYANLASTAIVGRDYPPALRYLEDGISYCMEQDLDAWTFYMLGWRAQLGLEMGEWSAAEDDANTVLRRPGGAAILRFPALAALALLRTRRGDPGAAELLDEAHAHAIASGEIQRIVPVAAARAEAAWLAWDLDGVRDAALDAFELVRQPARPWELGCLALWLWRAGGLPAPVDGIAEPYAREIGGDWRGAAAAWAELGCPYEEALALGGSADAEAIRTALRLLRELGAGPAADRVSQRARAMGIRGLPRGPRRSTRDNPARLTARQLRILALLAEGLSNAEIGRRAFISPRTVEHHVSAILAKLGARTRGEAATRALQQGILPLK